MANESLSPPNLASAPAKVHVHRPQVDLVPAEDLDASTLFIDLRYSLVHFVFMEELEFKDKFYE